MNQIVPKEVCKSVKKTFNVCSPQGYANKNCSQSSSIPTKGAINKETDSKYW